MRTWLLSLPGALALSALTLVSHLWRGFLDAMLVFPVDFGDRALMELSALVYTALFVGWAWALWAAAHGSRRGLVAAFALNGLLLLAVPVGWLAFYCPPACRAEAGVFNLANTLNLALGLLAGAALARHLFRPARPAVEAAR